MLKLLTLLSLFVYLLLFPIEAQAISLSPSNTVITKVGNPSSPAPGGDLAKAAQDLVNAYRSCSGGSTLLDSVDINCFTAALVSDKYSQSIVSSVTNLNSFSVSQNGKNCIQCIGFVRQSVILAYGGEDPKLATANGDTPVLDNWPTINNNGNIFNKVNGPPQIGDIASTGSSPDERIYPGSHGHILIVKALKPDTNSFIGLEANYNWINDAFYPPPSCLISDNVPHPDSYYVFYRLKQ